MPKIYATHDIVLNLCRCDIMDVYIFFPCNMTQDYGVILEGTADMSIACVGASTT
jgi:hypothetical protein